MTKGYILLPPGVWTARATGAASASLKEALVKLLCRSRPVQGSKANVHDVLTGARTLGACPQGRSWPGNSCHGLRRFDSPAGAAKSDRDAHRPPRMKRFPLHRMSAPTTAVIYVSIAAKSGESWRNRPPLRRPSNAKLATGTRRGPKRRLQPRGRLHGLQGRRHVEQRWGCLGPRQGEPKWVSRWRRSMQAKKRTTSVFTGQFPTPRTGNFMWPGGINRAIRELSS